MTRVVCMSQMSRADRAEPSSRRPSVRRVRLQHVVVEDESARGQYYATPRPYRELLTLVPSDDADDCAGGRGDQLLGTGIEADFDTCGPHRTR